jgi:glycosyltransferase
MAKMTLLTAAYNSAGTIGDTLRSVAAQDYPDIEHIVIDGLSKDNTVEIVRQGGTRVARIISEKDKGIYDAYNKGIALASGDVIGFINSDDFYASDDVISQVMRVFEDPSIEAVHADLVYVDQDNTAKIVRYWKSRPCTPKSLARGFIPAHPTVFLRREVYDKCGLFDLDFRLAADYEFLLRIFHTFNVKTVYVPKIWVRMRVGGATGGTVASIKLQNDEIRRGQAKHGLKYPTAKFYFHKVIDRTLQRVRAPFVKLPTSASV